MLLGRCVDVGDGELAYAPIAGALRSLASQVDAAELDAVLGSGRAELARLVPDLAGDDEPRPDPAAFGKERLFEFLLGTLGRLGRRRPVVLVVEDLHWADGSTRDLLRFLVRSVAGERLALIVTCRTDDLDRAHPVRPYLVEMRRDTARRMRRPGAVLEGGVRRSCRRDPRHAAWPGEPGSPVRALGGERLLHRGVARRGRIG